MTHILDEHSNHNYNYISSLILEYSKNNDITDGWEITIQNNLCTLSLKTPCTPKTVPTSRFLLFTILCASELS